MNKIINFILDLLYPSRCILCRKAISPGRPAFCTECREELPGASGVRIKSDYFSDCVSALYYTPEVRDAVLRYKFGGRESYRFAFGELVAERIYEELDGKYDTLSYVPLAPDRRRNRGYDQAQLIAEEAAKRLGKPCVCVLKKRRGVGAQSMTVGKEERRANIAGAYSVPASADIEGRRILLVDDVVTTGSTLSECAKTLLLAGAEDVVCATLAAASF